MKRIIIFALSILLAPSITYAREYSHYDLKRMRIDSKAAPGKEYSIDAQYMDKMLYELGLHAKNRPAQFDSPKDQKRAIQDVKSASKMIDPLIKGSAPNPEMLVRAGFLYIIAHNLDIPGSAKNADATFQKLLAVSPSNPDGNYLYGTFLASEGKTKRALPYLEKALVAGVADAAYTLGVAYLKLGDKQKALDNFEVFRQRSPYVVEDVSRLINELKMDIEKSKKTKK